MVAALAGCPAVAIGIGLVAMGLLFRGELLAAIAVWQNSTAYNHCFLVIPIVLYLIWDRRDALRSAEAKPFPPAIPAGLVLAIAWLIAERLGFMEGRQLVVMSFAQLLFFVVLGPRLWWLLAGPLLYLYFLVPFGAFLTATLQDVTTGFVTQGMTILRIPAYITGNTIEIPEGTFLIAEACAGLRFLIAAIAFGCFYALTLYRSPGRRVVFIGVSAVVPIIANGLRAAGIVALGHYLGSVEAAEADHVLYGWVFFSIVILLLGALGLPFREDPRTEVNAASVASRRDNLRPALAGAAALILLSAVGPATATQLDRFAVVDRSIDLPPLLSAAVCVKQPAPLTAGLDAPGRMAVRRFDCGNGPVTLAIEVFSPRSSAASIAVEQRRMFGTLYGDEVQIRPVPLSSKLLGAWELVQSPRSAHVVASSLWIDLMPTKLGLIARARLAWRSVVGGRSSPVLMMVIADVDAAPDAPGRQQAAARVVSFLQAQPTLVDFAARLAAATD